MFKHILLATDGSSASTHAAEMAVRLARIHGAQLTALFVVDPYPYAGVGEANPMGFQAYMSAAMQQASQAHGQVMALCEQEPRVTFHPRLAEELAPAPGILHTAEQTGADLIVVGSHGRTGMARLVLGSVASKVVAESRIPVLVAR